MLNTLDMCVLYTICHFQQTSKRFKGFKRGHTDLRRNLVGNKKIKEPNKALDFC